MYKIIDNTAGVIYECKTYRSFKKCLKELKEQLEEEPVKHKIIIVK